MGRRTSGRRGGAGRGRSAQDGAPTKRFAQETDGAAAGPVPRREPSLLPFRASKTTVLNYFVGSTDKGNPMQTESRNTTCGRRAVHLRDDGRSSFLAADQWNDVL